MHGRAAPASHDRIESPNGRDRIDRRSFGGIFTRRCGILRTSFSTRETRFMRIRKTFDQRNDVTLFHGDCLRLLQKLPDGAAQLVVTSPPYNVGKEYEKNLGIEDYIEFQRRVIQESVRIARPGGSICWQVGEPCKRPRADDPTGHLASSPFCRVHGDG